MNDLSWLGGFCDADGYITLSKDGSRYQPKVGFTNTNATMITNVCRILDANCVKYFKHVRDGAKDNHKPIWKVVVEGKKNCSLFIPLLLPHLVGKRDQANIVLEWSLGKRRTVFSNRDTELISSVRALNKRGLGR